MIAASPAGPLVEFFQMVPNQRPPQRADRAVGGVIPATCTSLLRSHYQRLGIRLVRLPAGQLQGGMGWGTTWLWTYDGVQEWLPLTRDRRAISAIQRTVQRNCPRKRARVLAAISHAIHSTGRIASVDWLHCQIRARLESACSAALRIFPRARRIRCSKASSRRSSWFGSIIQQRTNHQNRRTDRVSKRHSVPASSTGSQGSACRQVPAELHCKEPGAAISGKLGSLSTHGSHAKCRSRKKTGPVCRFGAEKGPPPPQSGYECRLDGGSRIAFAS